MASDRQRIATHILPRWGTVKLDDILALDVQEWASELAGRRAADTTRKVHGLLDQMLAYAVRHGLLPANPCDGTILPGVPPGREVYFTRAEVEAMAAAFDTTPYSAVTIVLAYTGLRWGELAGLQVGAVDLDGRRMHVVRTETRLGPKDYPKGRRRRTIQIADRAAEVLEPFMRRHRDVREPVFQTQTGRSLIFAHYPQVYFPEALRSARVDGRAIFKDGHPHDLRHTCASWLVQAGVPLLDVSHWLGHADIRSTMRYAHLAPDFGGRAVAALNAAPSLPPTWDSGGKRSHAVPIRSQLTTLRAL